MLQRLIGEDIDLRANTPDEPLCVRVDPSQIEQIVLNLVLNARQAMPEGGRLALTVDPVEIDEEDVVEQINAITGPAVRLTVTDNGIGMDEETLEHCFEPFFSTRQRDKGTGLGLATVYGIVTRARGHITVESEPGKGTTFRVLLPRVEYEAEQLSLDTTVAPARGTETVLLVEDEPELRGLARDVLAREGYRVITADGKEAIELVRTGADDFDLLLTDVVMPGVSGFAVAEAATKYDPELSVLFISGYAEDLDSWSEARHFLAKPFTPVQLIAKVRSVLDARTRELGGR